MERYCPACYFANPLSLLKAQPLPVHHRADMYPQSNTAENHYLKGNSGGTGETFKPCTEMRTKGVLPPRVLEDKIRNHEKVHTSTLTTTKLTLLGP